VLWHKIAGYVTDYIVKENNRKSRIFMLSEKIDK